MRMSIVQPELFFPSPTLLQSLYIHYAQLYIHYVQWCPGDCKHRINLVNLLALCTTILIDGVT